ncbi:protein BEAN1 isoform X2 [Carettochelys insculpta]|uniref:protein BEAN1 isoform X2 n=1 Tax=Carettochelys insculpta TaxID=44489 RepID=UPI003EBBC0F4
MSMKISSGATLDTRPGGLLTPGISPRYKAPSEAFMKCQGNQHIHIGLPPGAKCNNDGNEEVHANQSGPLSEFPGYSENSNDTSLLVSPLLVAGVVIGLVLFLSCVTIIVGSLRKDGRLRHPHLRRDLNYAPDGFSYGGSIGELRSTCTEDFPPAFDFSSYMESLSQVNVMYPDSPPRYDECIGPGATQIYIPTDDPPPYSLTDPCQRNELSVNISAEEEAASGTTGRPSRYPVRLQDLQQPLTSISLATLTQEAAPPYEVVVCEQNSPIPLVPMDVQKNSSTDCQTLLNQII